MTRLAIFARAPIRGRVKTRLAKDIGTDAALLAYRELLALTLSRLAPGRGAFSPEIWVEGDSPEVVTWRRSFAVFMQPPGDIGERMAAAFEAGVDVLVGCDIPCLTAAYVDEAVAALADADLVLGPTEDGGYCLVAMREPHLGIFQNVPWSTGHVLTATLEAASGLSVKTLDRLWDVDDGDDFRRWQSSRETAEAAKGSCLACD